MLARSGEGGSRGAAGLEPPQPGGGCLGREPCLPVPHIATERASPALRLPARHGLSPLPGLATLSLTTSLYTGGSRGDLPVPGLIGAKASLRGLLSCSTEPVQGSFGEGTCVFSGRGEGHRTGTLHCRPTRAQGSRPGARQSVCSAHPHLAPESFEAPSPLSSHCPRLPPESLWLPLIYFLSPWVCLLCGPWE